MTTGQKIIERLRKFTEDLEHGDLSGYRVRSGALMNDEDMEAIRAEWEARQNAIFGLTPNRLT